MRDTTECGSQQPVASIQKESDKASREGVKNDVIDLTMDDDDMWEPDWISDDEKPALRADDRDVWSDDEVEIVKDLRPIPPRQPVAGPSSRTGQGLSSRNTTGETRRAVSDPYPRAGPSTKANLRGKPHTRPPPSSSYEGTQNRPAWKCEICTLINEPFTLQCDACGMRKPLDQKAGWMCLACGETGMPHEFWTCRVCGVVKSSS